MRTALVGLLLLGLATAMRVVALPLAHPALPPRTEVRELLAVAAAPIVGDSALQRIVVHDPFRIGRRPSPLAYDPVQLAQPPVAPPPKPTLALSGLVWDGGRNPTALIEGLPGADGPRPVRAGEAMGALRVKRIEHDRVVIVGLDTTWVLSVKEPWR